MIARSLCAAPLLAFTIFSSGCAGTQSHLRLLESSGDVRVQSVEASDHDYVVSIRNTVDFGHNPDNKETRDRIALQLLETQCPAASVIGEDVIETGSYLGGRPSRVYQVKIACR